MGYLELQADLDRHANAVTAELRRMGFKEGTKLFEAADNVVAWARETLRRRFNDSDFGSAGRAFNDYLDKRGVYDVLREEATQANAPTSIARFGTDEMRMKLIGEEFSAIDKIVGDSMNSPENTTDSHTAIQHPHHVQ